MKKEKLNKEQEKVKTKIEKKEQTLAWNEILLLMGRPLWDIEKQKWRILNGYQSVLGNETNELYRDITFTDTPYWENFQGKKLFLSIPNLLPKEENKGNGFKGSDKNSKRAQTKNER